MTRPILDAYFIEIAKVVAERSTCDRAHVGCVLVRDKQILTTGYNGSCRGLDHCDDIGHLLDDGHCVRTIHAEINAIIQAARHGVSTDNSIAYITHFPCLTCAKALINAGITRIVYAADYRRIAHAATFLQQAHVEVIQYEFS